MNNEVKPQKSSLYLSKILSGGRFSCNRN